MGSSSGREKGKKALLVLGVLLGFYVGIQGLLKTSLLFPLLQRAYSSAGIQLGDPADQMAMNTIVNRLVWETEQAKLTLDGGEIALASNGDLLLGGAPSFPFINVDLAELQLKKPFDSKKQMPPIGLILDQDSPFEGLKIDTLSVKKLVVKSHDGKELTRFNKVSLGNLKLKEQELTVGSFVADAKSFQVHIKKAQYAQQIFQWKSFNLILNPKTLPVLKQPIILKGSGKIAQGKPSLVFMGPKETLKIQFSGKWNASVLGKEIPPVDYFKRYVHTQRVTFELKEIPLFSLIKLDVQPYLASYRVNMGNDIYLGHKRADQSKEQDVDWTRVERRGQVYLLRFSYDEKKQTLFEIKNPASQSLKTGLAQTFFKRSAGRLDEQQKKELGQMLPLFSLSGSKDAPVLIVKGSANGTNDAGGKQKVTQQPSREASTKQVAKKESVPAQSSQKLDSQQRKPAALVSEGDLYPFSFIDAPMYVPPKEENNRYTKEVVQVDQQTKVLVQRNPQGYKILERTFRRGKMIKSVYWTNDGAGKILLVKEWPAPKP